MGINYESQMLHSKLSTFLKLVVYRTISQLKAPRPPVEVTANQSGEAPPVFPGLRRVRTVAKSTVVGNLLSFEFPETLNRKIDMDKLPHLEKEGNLSERLFSFKERIEGWSVERRQRENGRCDVYYRHRKSRRVFRSIHEMVNFMMYESCPESRKRKSPSSRRVEEDREEEMIWENDNEGSVDHYKRLEDEAAEALVSMCDDGTPNNKEDQPAGASFSSAAATAAADDDNDDAVDLINHIPISGSMEEVQEFLISNRKAMQSHA